MDDRKLLEAAAKAAGIKLEEPSAWFVYSDDHGFQRLNIDGTAVLWSWSPLTDNGDAFALAVKLRLIVHADSDRHGDVAARAGDQWFIEPGTTNPYAAVRRAIVKAAAAQVPPQSDTSAV